MLIGSEIFFILKRLDASKSVFPGVFTIVETICPKIWAKKKHFRLTCVAQKRLCLSSLESGKVWTEPKHAVFVQCRKRTALLTATFKKPRVSQLPYNFTFPYWAASSRYGHRFRVLRVSGCESFHCISLRPWPTLVSWGTGYEFLNYGIINKRPQSYRAHRVLQNPQNWVITKCIVRTPMSLSNFRRFEWLYLVQYWHD